MCSTSCWFLNLEIISCLIRIIRSRNESFISSLPQSLRTASTDCDENIEWLLPTLHVTPLAHSSNISIAIIIFNLKHIKSVTQKCTRKLKIDCKHTMQIKFRVSFFYVRKNLARKREWKIYFFNENSLSVRNFVFDIWTGFTSDRGGTTFSHNIDFCSQ